MGAQQNIDTVNDMYAAFGRGDVDAILERLTDDVDWAAEAAAVSAPWHGARHGKDEVRDFFVGIASTGPVAEFTPISITSNDNDEVQAFIRYEFTATATGKTARSNLHHFWRFRDGKACFVRCAEDTAQTVATLSHEPAGVAS